MEQRKESLGVIAALKMLDASERALDKEVAKLIRALLKEIGDATNERVARVELAALQTEHRGALLELDEMYSRLGRVLRNHCGNFNDTDTARSLACEAAETITHLRMDIADKDARIDKLMARQQELMNAVADAQDGNPTFPPRNKIKHLPFSGAEPCDPFAAGGPATLHVDGHYPVALGRSPSTGDVVAVNLAPVEASDQPDTFVPVYDAARNVLVARGRAPGVTMTGAADVSRETFPSRETERKARAEWFDEMRADAFWRAMVKVSGGKVDE